MAKKEITPQPAKKTAAASGAKATKTKAEAAKVKPAAKPSKPAAKPAAAKPAPKAAQPAPAPAKKSVPAKPAPKPAAKPAPAKPAPKAPAKKVAAPAPKPAPKKVAAPAPKPAPKKEAPPKEAPKKAAPVKAAPAKPAAKPAPEKKAVAQKAPLTKKEIVGKANGGGATAFETEARKLAIQKIQAKRNQGAANQRPAVVVATGLEPSQPTGMYNGIVVTHDIKPFAAKTPYSKQELDKLREALLEEREKLLGQLASLQGVSMEAMVSAKEHAGYSIHIAEHASDLQAAEANMGVRTIEEERLEQVESALDRIENNQRHYGLCMACGNKIGIQRLIAVPHAHLCMPCRQRYETIRSRRGY